MIWGEAEDYGALPDELVRRTIRRVLELAGPETALGLYLTHYQWRLRKGLPFLLPEEVGIFAQEKKVDGKYGESGGNASEKPPPLGVSRHRRRKNEDDAQGD